MNRNRMIRHKWASMLKAVVVIGLTIAAYVYVPYTFKLPPDARIANLENEPQ